MTPEVPARAAVVSALSGDLPCLRCRYNLRGLSVLGACPECGTPVRATLLSVVDPLASELQPVRWRRTVAWGIVVWSAAAVAAAVLLWIARAVDGLELLLERPLSAEWASNAALAALVMSGIGASVLVRPHAGIPARHAAAATLGLLAYVPMTWCRWRLAGLAGTASYVRAFDPDPRQAAVRLLFHGALAVALLSLRPNARTLAARSLLMREGHVDRQTMLAMVAAVGVGAVGDALHWNLRQFPSSWTPVVGAVGTLLLAVSSLLVTLGLVSVLVDAWRIRDVILDPPPTLRDLIARREGGA